MDGCVERNRGQDRYYTQTSKALPKLSSSPSNYLTSSKLPSLFQLPRPRFYFYRIPSLLPPVDYRSLSGVCLYSPSLGNFSIPFLSERAKGRHHPSFIYFILSFGYHLFLSRKKVCIYLHNQLAIISHSRLFPVILPTCPTTKPIPPSHDITITGALPAIHIWSI